MSRHGYPPEFQRKALNLVESGWELVDVRQGAQVGEVLGVF